MSIKTDNFINGIAPLAVNEYLSRGKWILPSVCIAQAALESGWNLEAKTLFGIKGEGFKASTTEYYNGHKVEIEASFRDYGGVAGSVVGYYDFLANTPRYAGVINNSNYKDAVDKLIHTVDGLAYATDPDYINKVVSIIEKYNLTRFDVRPSESEGEREKEVDKVTIEQIIKAMSDKGFTVATNNANELKFIKVSAVKTLKDGDVIKLKEGAKYYNGSNIPTWVLKKTLYYRGKNNNGIIFSTLKTGAITGVVKPEYVV